MELGKKKEGYGYLIKWLIGLGDLIVINLVFFFLYKFISISWNTVSGYNQLGIVFLLINLSYFITASVVPVRLFLNIIFFDKVIQRSLLFITLYFVLFTFGLLLFQIGNYNLSDWGISYLTLCFVFTVWHVFLRSVIKIYRGKGYNYKRIIIVGGGDNAVSIYNELKSGDYGYKILGLFNDTAPTEETMLPYLGNFAEIERFCIENNVDEIYCTLPNNREDEIIRLVNFSEKNMIRFFLVPDFYGYIHRKLVLSFLQSTPVIAIRSEPLQLLHNRIIKRAFDIVFSLTILLTVFPVIFVIFGFLIKVTSKGPVFFKQKRTGLHGKSFVCYKFRSMVLNDDSDTMITTSSDPRITRVGAFMRRSSIDEFPQFFNVLMGNMSVVGPRPHMIKQTDVYNRLIDRFMIRHIIKPGITGWAQISGYRGETKILEQMEGRLKRDVWYIENWSFILDLKIIAVTVYQILKGDDKAF